MSKNKRFVLSAMGCVFEVVFKGFVETACLGLLGELYMALTSIILTTLNIHKLHGYIQASFLVMYLDKQGSGYRPYGLW